MRFAEFFAGGGMVSEALKGSWTCVYANDVSSKKAESYFANHGSDAPLEVKSIEHVNGAEVPEVDMMWGSFPCQDLSLAGNRAGLNGARSGMFFEFFRVLDEMIALSRKPPILAVENVVGLIRSNGGADLQEVMAAFQSRGYRAGWFVLDAADFVPQSRPRLFVVGIDARLNIPEPLVSVTNSSGGVNWRLPDVSKPIQTAEDLIENNPSSVNWHDSSDTQKLLAMMSPINLQKVHRALSEEKSRVGFIYKRTRTENGKRVQRAEVRFDGFAGCLRTPGGGSSRQFILKTWKGELRSRLLSTREAARLMGLPDTYKLPQNYNQAYHLLGDGVVAPVVKHIAQHIFEPVLMAEIKEAA